MTDYIQSISGEVIALRSGMRFRVESGYTYRLQGWKSGDRVKVGSNYIVHEKKEKKVLVRRE